MVEFLRVMQVTFGEKVKNLREDMDMTQSELGDKINMTQRRVSYIEKNKYEPSLEDIRVICKFFKVSSDYLLDLPDGLKRPK